MAEDEQDEEMTNGDSNNDVSRDLATDEHIKDPVEDRRTLAERNERLHDQLKVNKFYFEEKKEFFLNLKNFTGFETRFGSIT